MSYFVLILLMCCASFYIGKMAYRIIHDFKNVEISEIIITLICVVFVVSVWTL